MSYFCALITCFPEELRTFPFVCDEVLFCVVISFRVNIIIVNFIGCHAGSSAVLVLIFAI